MKRGEIAAELRSLLQGGAPGDLLPPFLEANGFSYGARTAANIASLRSVLPVDTLVDVVVASLSSPLPDMALNSLERLSSAVPPAELLDICGRKQRVSQLLVLCGSSPFLLNTLCKEPSELRRLFLDGAISVRRSESESLTALRSFAGEGTDYPSLLPLLRAFKYREILRIAARDLNGLAPLEEVTAELAALASSTLQIAYEGARRHLTAEHGVPLEIDEEGVREAEFSIIGMGKLGGRELNFSSDIDLIYFYSSSHGETSGTSDGRGKIPLHSFFVKLAELVTRAISQVTPDGFVFRVDLGLRPEGKSGSMAVSQRAAEVYYESWGQPWERAAMLKARPVAGSLELGERILRSLQPFIYRRYLDYTLVEDMMGMKKKIDASLVRNREGEQNLKLGRGGIREIEFFIQALQLIYAGKNSTLRERNSLKALATLEEARLISPEDARALAEAYRFLRMVEHRIQVVQERQTHNLPQKKEELLALARRCGFLRSDGLTRFWQVLEAHRQAVSERYGSLFLERDRKLKEEVRPEIYHFLDHRADADLVKDMLAEKRVANVDAAYENLLVLRDGPSRVRMTERGRRSLEQIAPLLLQQIFDSPDPDMALANLERFLGATGGRTSFYALLAENRETLKLLVSLFGMSDFLSKIFIAHPELLDSMVSSSHASFVKERGLMERELHDLLSRSPDFEESLDILRRYRHEEFLRIGMNDIYGHLGQTEIAVQLTDLAEVCLAAACRLAAGELTRFGRPTWAGEDGTVREAKFAVVGLGKMGGRELNYHSDLDIIYIYDRQGTTDGERQISNHEYFAKLGQKIIAILTTTTREGYAYKLDTRLRPSGNAGPLVTNLESFREYHRSEAQLWERQALTKARVVCGEEGIAREISSIIEETVFGSGAAEEDRREIHRLRMRMEVELARERDGSYNIKTGRGGMVDVEFVVQYLQLLHGKDHPQIRLSNTLLALKKMHELELVEEEDYLVLLQGYKFLRRLENRLRIYHDYSINDLGGSADYLDKLARRTGYDPKLRHPGKALIEDYERTTGSIRRVYDRIVGA